MPSATAFGKAEPDNSTFRVDAPAGQHDLQPFAPCGIPTLLAARRTSLEVLRKGRGLQGGASAAGV